MSRRILVLGANGFIGRHVLAALAASGWATPVAAGRRAAPGSGPSLQFDATDAEPLRRALDGIDGVVNCVAGSNDTLVAGARVLFETAAARDRPPRIVHLSSMAVYGDAVGDVDESTALTAASSPYGAAKREAERLAAGYGSAAVLRLGIVYGPDSAQWSGRIAQLLDAHRLGDLGRGGDGICNLTYVGDAATAVLRSLEQPPGAARTYNLSMPDPPTWNDYFSRYALALGAVPLARISRRRLKIESKLLAPPLKILEIAAGKAGRGLGQRVPQPIPPSLLRLFAQEIRLNVDRSRRELGMEWTPLEEGLCRSVAWYRAAR